MLRLLPLVALVLLQGCATTSAADRLTAFEMVLASNDSATAALGQWCAQRELAASARITAVPNGGRPHPATAQVRALLGVSASEPVGFRNVSLHCGDKVLSRALNWYVPARLTPAMNAALEGSDTPFGTVVSPLGFTRERLANRRGASADCPPGTILSHSALLRLPDGAPISLVAECYTAESLR